MAMAEGTQRARMHVTSVSQSVPWNPFITPKCLLNRFNNNFGALCHFTGTSVSLPTALVYIVFYSRSDTDNSFFMLYVFILYREPDVENF